MPFKPFIRSIVAVSIIIIFISNIYPFQVKRDKYDTKINLRWIKAYEGETWEKIQTGLAWSLSFLGAELPSGSLNKSIKRIDSSLFSIDFSQVGFNIYALQQIAKILDTLKKTDEYHKMQGIDLGRFIVLTVYSTNHYYAITGVEKQLSSFIQKYRYLNHYQSFAIINSGVARENRLVKFKPVSAIKKLAFIAEEGHGDLKKGTFTTEVYEVFDVMKNGQLRFAVYDKSGSLIPATPSEFGNPMFGGAGKPGKCMWCHESNLQPLFYPTDEVVSYCSKQLFLSWIDSSKILLEKYRNGLRSDINYHNKQDHTFSELLYISFMEPSLMRLSNEWHEDTLTIRKRLKNTHTHSYEEFPFLGSLYFRDTADQYAPYTSIIVPQSVREESDFEPYCLE